MKITVELVKSLRPKPCYEDSKLLELIGNGIEVTEECVNIALSLPKNDCRLLLARLLNSSNRIVWAKESAERAKKYSNSAYAADVYAAAVAAAAADAYYDAYTAEHKLAVEHAIKLLITQE